MLFILCWVLQVLNLNVKFSDWLAISRLLYLKTKFYFGKNM